MKDYKRLTERDEFGNADIIGLDSNELASNLDFDGLNKLTSALNKFSDLEDKIESGELCDRKETAKEILDWMETVWRSNGGCFQKYMFESMRKEYGLEDEE